ncbi:MAG: recombinase family protein [Bacilli bacterium]|nr:recombinase family protein [Bacilli bacterium]
MNYDCGAVKALLNIYKPEEIAKYIRLSLADEESEKQKPTDESESVTNQRRLINNFIDRNGNIGANCKEFIDDGCSGTNFDRPGWNKLQEQMEAGKIKVVITKSLSRLGRSNFECSYFLDYYFPENNIRYIAIQEQIDTGNGENTNNEYAALNNFINEKYSRDLSKNIKRVYRMKQQSGEYMGGIPVFGYKKDPNDKHKLIIDEEAANIVKEIFEKYLELQSQSGVMKYLTDKKVPIPEVYKGTRRGVKAKHPYEWNYHTVRNILRNQMYIGDMVQNVHIKKSFREKKIIKNDKENWIIVEGTHEPIIDKETFDRVQNLLDVNFRQPAPEYQRTFKGLMFCHECGHLIGVGNPKRDNRPIEKQYVYTYCNYYRKNSAYNKCTPHTMNYNNLEDQLLSIITNVCNKYINLVGYDDLVENRKKTLTTYTSDLEKKVGRLEIDLKTIDLKIEKLYMDRLDDIITPDTYKKLTDKFEEQKNEIQKQIDELNQSINEYKENNKVEDLLETQTIVKEYLKTRKNPPRELILKIIDKIEIHQDKTVDLHFKLKQLEEVV